MSKNPTVSVLMPVYNAERYLAEAVESILAQTFKDFEFIIVDDGSTDASLKILETYAKRDERIRLKSRENIGYAKTLNEMLTQAKGDFIARMDADDIALPERLARQVEFLQRESAVVCVGGLPEVIDEKGRLLTRIKLPRNNDEIQQMILSGQVVLSHPTVMIRRSALLEVGGYDDAMVPAEDLDLWLRLGEVGELANLEDTLLKYRMHTKSVSAQNSSRQYLRAREACERAWRRRGIEGRFEVTQPWRPGSDRPSQHKHLLMCGWWAFNSSQRQTALIYAMKAIATLPLAFEGWKLLSCAVIKRLPVHESQNFISHANR